GGRLCVAALDRASRTAHAACAHPYTPGVYSPRICWGGVSMGKRTVEGRTDGDAPYRISRRHFLISTGALIAASACSTAPPQQAAQNLPEGTVKLTAWTIGPDAPSYYRRDNLITAGEALTKEVSAQNAKTSVQVDATFESGGRWDDYKQKFVLAAEAKQGPDISRAG